MNFNRLFRKLLFLPLLIVGAEFSFLFAEESDAVFFTRKSGNPAQLRSQIVFLENDGLGVVVTEATANFKSGTYQGQPVELVAYDPVSRLSLIRVPLQEGRVVDAAELGSALDLKIGDPVYTSIEKESEPSRIISWASEYNGQPLPLELLRLHHPAEQKPSIGHPFFDSAGRLVGINYRKATEFGNGSFVFPVEAIKRLLGATVEEGIVQRSWFGVELLASDPFAVVQGVRVASPAAKAGILKGDILLQIGSRPVQRYSDAINAFYYLREGKAEKVRFIRGTSVEIVEVTPELVPEPADLPPKKDVMPKRESIPLPGQ